MAGAAVPVRYAEVVSCLSVAQDLCFGQPAGSQQRACLVALGLAREWGLSRDEQATAYWTSQLRFLGCTGHAHEIAVVFGDDITTRARSFDWDPANPVDLTRELVLRTGSQHAGLRRARAVLAVLAGGRRGAELNFRTGCEVAGELGRRLGLPDQVDAALAHSFERWNGSGYPRRVAGQDIPVAARVALVAQELEVLTRVHGMDDGMTTLRHRSGRSYDPDLVTVAAAVGPELIAGLAEVDPWDAVLDHDPDPRRLLEGDDLDDALRVVADFVDLKSPFTPGHSRGVATLAEAAARTIGLPEPDRSALYRAGLIHDIGRCAVSNAVWDKGSALTRDERDLVETHALRSEQLARRVTGLSTSVPAVGHHHERVDGTGYHRGARASVLPLASRVLAAADAYQALTEPRAHRPARSHRDAGTALRAMAGNGHLDPRAVDAILTAVGQAPGTRQPPPDGLTPREIEVLLLLARGLTTRDVAARLGISAKTADAHIQHLYPKIGVSTRGAAALYAVQSGLLPLTG